MILVDANLLLYAYNTDAPEHQRAAHWLEEVFSGSTLFALSWQTIAAFIRISTNIRAFPQPLRLSEATEIVAEWLSRPNVVVLQPTERHREIFRRLLEEAEAIGPLVMDAQLATLAIEHGATLATTDRDFLRFPDLQMINPLEDKA